MGYIPTEWETGDVVTAEKLNNIESGIVNNNTYMVSIISNVDESTGDETLTLDKTWQEIFDAAQSGKLVKFIQNTVEEYPDTEEVLHEIIYLDLMGISYGPVWDGTEEKYVDFYGIGIFFYSVGPVTFKASDPNDYPFMEDQK